MFGRKSKEKTGRDLSYLPTGLYIPGIEFPDEAPTPLPDEERLSKQAASGELLELMQRMAAQLAIGPEYRVPEPTDQQKTS